MKILLINTPHYDMDGFLGAPTSIHYASVLVTNSKDLPYDIEFCEPRTLEILEQELKKLDYDIYAFSTTSHSHWVALKAALSIKKRNNKSIIIFGGPHEDELIKYPEEKQTLHRWGDIVDIVIKGDGENAFKWVLDKLNDKCTLNNLISYSEEIKNLPGKGEIDIKTQQKNSILSFKLSNTRIDLNELPSINWNFVSDHNFYNYPIFKHKNGITKRTAQIISHRGCRGGCKYCSEGQAYNSRDTGCIISEIDCLVKNHNVEAIFFDDSTLTEDRKFTLELCDLLKPLNIEWGCLTRFDKVDEEILSAMKDSGCSYIYFGLEQYDNKVLKAIGKRITIREIDHSVDLCADLNIRIGMSCLFGTGESREVALKTIRKVSEWIKKNTLVMVSTSANCIHLGASNISCSKEEMDVDFDQEPPNLGLPWIAFEEGIWHHPKSFTVDYAWFLLENIIEHIPLEFLARHQLLDNKIDEIKENLNTSILSQAHLQFAQANT